MSSSNRGLQYLQDLGDLSNTRKRESMSDLVCCLTNENKEFQYDVLESIINKPELLDVPIVIYSITGPTRTGKSYLLNILWYLLKNQHTFADERVNENEKIPQLFASNFTLEAVTAGIHMTKKPIFMYAKNAKIAVFLMDTEGSQAGDKIECKEADIFTISLTLSFMQIINVKDRFTYPNFDMYAALNLHAKDTSVLGENIKNLTLLIRDWRHTHEYRHGFEEGNAYFQSFSDKDSYKTQSKFLNLFYDKKECCLMPCPGDQVENSNSKHRKDIDQTTWLKLLELKKNLFSTLNIQRAFEIAPKGREFLAIASQLRETLSSPSRLVAPESSFQNFLDLVMRKRVTKCLKNYKVDLTQVLAIEDIRKTGLKQVEKIVRARITKTFREGAPVDDLSPYDNMLRQKLDEGFECMTDIKMKNKVSRCFDNYKNGMKMTFENENDLENIHTNHKEIVSATLEEESLVDDVTPYIKMLYQQINEEYEMHTGRLMAIAFANEWTANIKKKGNFVVKEVSRFYLEEGIKYIERITGKIRNENARQIVLKEFVGMMNKKFDEEVGRRRRNKSIAKVSVAAPLGAVAGGLMVLIPPLGAAAVASTVATEVVVGLTAGGLGAAGGAAAGLPAWFIDRLVQNQHIDPPHLLPPRDDDNQNENENNVGEVNADDNEQFIP